MFYNLFLFPIVILLNITIMDATENKTYVTVEPAEFAKVIENPGVYTLDVREPEAYAEGHIKGAEELDVNDADFLEKAKKQLPANKTIAVYCRTGKRSAMASEILSKAGYKIVNLDGGITNWESKGFPVVKD